jgi:geranylgeranyl pyrophosphate synthase
MKMDNLYVPVADGLEMVEKALQNIAEVDIPILATLLEYAVQSTGKKIRPAFTLLCGKFYNYNLDKLIPMSVGVELLHVATLVHDDIIDESELRRGKPTVKYAWGENAALLLGDYLFAQAAKSVATTGNQRVIELFAQTLMTISGGELAQINVLFDAKRAREHYYEWIAAKTACLFSTATESGAVLSDAPEEVIQALKNYGYYFGMAFQVIDDILDFIGKEAELGKPVGSDLMEGAVTLPTIIYAESNPEHDILEQIIDKKDRTEVVETMEKIRKSSALDKCMDIARDFSRKAASQLEILPDNEYRNILSGLVDLMLERKK